jgi:preprotein translocase subunit YajC
MRRQKHQSGFIPMIIMLVLMLVIVIYVSYQTVRKAQG